MNCDRVFDILTRGPFPSGAPSDDRVERHLSACPACRRLAAALQPAIELFEEAITPEEGRDLPAYWGELFLAEQEELGPRGSTWRGGTTTGIATRLRRATGLDLETVRRTLPTAWRLAAAVLLGVCVGGLLRSADLSGSGARPPRVTEVVAQPNPEAEPTHVAAAMLPERSTERPDHADQNSPLVACVYAAKRQGDESVAIAAAMPNHGLGVATPARLQFACCTECHHHGNRIEPPLNVVDVAIVGRSCEHCHPN